jgi:hypothetical protein
MKGLRKIIRELKAIRQKLQAMSEAVSILDQYLARGTLEDRRQVLEYLSWRLAVDTESTKP